MQNPIGWRRMSVFPHRVSQGSRSSCHVVPLLPKTLADSEERQTHMENHTDALTSQAWIRHTSLSLLFPESDFSGWRGSWKISPIISPRGEKWFFVNTHSSPWFWLLWLRCSYPFPKSWKNHFKISRTSVSKLLTFKMTYFYKDLFVLFCLYPSPVLRDMFYF